MAIDPGELRARTRAALGGWNELGRGICERFLAVSEGAWGRGSGRT
jgi:hypothetical protein